jgi:16S rRNA (adenine1518-N6/adenine1519-N6)-dimethyltransferase
MELNYNSPASLAAFLEARGMGMRKKYGQNFLVNESARRALADALAAECGADVWEIGPGLGAMTRLLLDCGLCVRAFEIDAGFAAALGEIFAGEKNFTLVKGDALKTWVSQPAAPYLLGNLPYNIAAALLGSFIEQGRFFKRMVVTVQREMAQRMAAHPGSRDYSSFSVLCASAYHITPLQVLKGASFYPRPNVESQGVRLELRSGFCQGVYPPVFYPMVRALFSSRRKMIKNNLANFLAARPAQRGDSAAVTAASALAECGISGGERAENLGLDAFAALAKILEDMQN